MLVSSEAINQFSEFEYQLSVSALEGVDGEVPVGPDQSELDSTFDSGPLHIPAVWSHHLPDAGARG